LASEHEVVAATPNLPATVDSLQKDLLHLGIQPGCVLLVHSSLSKMGWVCGGAPAVILALEGALGQEGTLVMPAHSGDLSDPAAWENPPVPESWWELIRTTMPAYDPDMTPTRGMGIIAETFRKQAGALRSAHPQVSFAARGPMAGNITAGHMVEFRLGESSPLARLYDLEAWVLLLGVGHENNTSLHLAENRADDQVKRFLRDGAPIFVNGSRNWVWFNDLDEDTEDFPSIGADFESETGLVRHGKVGCASAMLFPQRQLVDYAVKWMNTHRKIQG